MASMLTSPPSILLALLLLLAALGAAWRGARLLVRGLREAAHPTSSLWLVRGL